MKGFRVQSLGCFNFSHASKGDTLHTQWPQCTRSSDTRVVLVLLNREYSFYSECPCVWNVLHLWNLHVRALDVCLGRQEIRPVQFIGERLNHKNTIFRKPGDFVALSNCSCINLSLRWGRSSRSTNLSSTCTHWCTLSFQSVRVWWRSRVQFLWLNAFYDWATLCGEWVWRERASAVRLWWRNAENDAQKSPVEPQMFHSAQQYKHRSQRTQLWNPIKDLVSIGLRNQAMSSKIFEGCLLHVDVTFLVNSANKQASSKWQLQGVCISVRLGWAHASETWNGPRGAPCVMPRVAKSGRHQTLSQFLWAMFLFTGAENPGDTAKLEMFLLCSVLWDFNSRTSRVLAFDFCGVHAMNVSQIFLRRCHLNDSEHSVKVSGKANFNVRPEVWFALLAILPKKCQDNFLVGCPSRKALFKGFNF